MKRIQLEVRQERLQELKALMEQAHMSTQKDLINDALTLFEWAVAERKAGRAIGSMDETNQKYREVVMPSLERAASKMNGKTDTFHQVGA
ncbi:MAG: hypothetical protein WBQ65_00335 [Bryobacteraceae bacterium]